MSTTSKQAMVHMFLPGSGYTPAGVLTYTPGVNARFRYGDRYAVRNDSIPLDPIHMPLTQGRFFESSVASDGYEIHPALRDAAPDRFGRKLLSLMSLEESEALNEFEILTAAFHPDRIGALAFGPVNISKPSSMAPWAKNFDYSFTMDDIPDIGAIISKISVAMDDEKELARLRAEYALNPFAQAVSSLYSAGGARPKIMIKHNGAHYLAKFSKPDDGWDEPAIECGTLELARRCGIAVPAAFLLPYSEQEGKHALLIKRFDRTKRGHPLHLISAFTLLGLREDEDWGSYRDMSDAMRQCGQADAPEQLWRRMVFNIMVCNTDDHPRNHAFFVTRDQVKLAPGFDITPQFLINPGGQAMRCGDKGRERSLENGLSQCEGFGLRRSQAENILEVMLSKFKNWKEHYARYGVDDHGLELLDRRFILQESGSRVNTLKRNEAGNSSTFQLN